LQELPGLRFQAGLFFRIGGATVVLVKPPGPFPGAPGHVSASLAAQPAPSPLFQCQSELDETVIALYPWGKNRTIWAFL
jgi:hypothetical protein